ncbi:MAG: Cobyrinate a,c-diamide synthase [Myxococcota bacterium]|nr:Cobyrinate a,c-diamide synthase [Myxococcota bacterium]
MEPHSTSIPRLVIAGTHSGVGKTLIACALIELLRRQGLKIAVFKCGPDFLDPFWLRNAARGRCFSLDGWIMGRTGVLRSFIAASREADIAILEGMMGLHDGALPVSPEGSTAEIADWLAAPVLLVTDASGLSRSAAALVQGYARFDPAIRMDAWFANRAGGEAHAELLKQAVAAPPLAGWLGAHPELKIEDQHLGLVQPQTETQAREHIAMAAEALKPSINLELIQRMARQAPAIPAVPLVTGPVKPGLREAPLRGIRPVRIGLAQDAAFSFYYPFNLQLLQDLGVELVPFSPIADKALPDVDGLYIGGGYPENHAAALEENNSLRQEVRAFCASGAPVYAECGGMMYLSRSITTLDGGRYAMAGVIDQDIVMNETLQALGYAEAGLKADGPLGRAGTRMRGHQFRYSHIEGADAREGTLFDVRAPGSRNVLSMGYLHGAVAASYIHVHFASNPGVAESFVRACARFAAPLEAGVGR